MILGLGWTFVLSLFCTFPTPFLSRSPSNVALHHIQTEAWQTANSLLVAQDLPLEPRLFAAQTFRAKVSTPTGKSKRQT